MAGPAEASADGELKEMLEKAFPGSPWDDERVAAFKEAKRLCEEQYAADEELPVEGESGGLGDIFGPAPAV